MTTWNRSAAHHWLDRHYLKTGFCEECDWMEGTQWAFLRHPAPYTFDRADYRELCPKCHSQLDRKIRDPLQPTGYVYAQ